jgi:hypothetical protein
MAIVAGENLRERDQPFEKNLYSCPVLPRESFNAGELGNIGRHEGKFTRQGLASDQGVISADGRAGGLKRSTDRSRDSAILLFEGEQDDRASQKSFKPLRI